MDIEDFYDADPRRRASEEVTFGLNWASAGNPELLWDLFWVRDTGELYLMGKPAPPRWLPLIAGERHPGHHRVKAGSRPSASDGSPLPGVGGDADGDAESDGDDLGVEVVATVATEGEVTTMLHGWEEAVRTPDGLAWLRERVANA